MGTGIGMAENTHGLPIHFISHNGDSDTNINEPDNDEDGGNVEGTTMEAYVDLAKIACRDYTT
jgi:hypothetical protein